MSVRANFVLLGVLVALSGCGGQSSVNGFSTASTVPTGPSGSDAGAPSSTRTYPLTRGSGSYDFTPVGGFSGSVALPAADVPPQTNMQLVSSLDAPTDAPILQSERRMQSTGTLDVFFYTTIRLSNTVTFPMPPGFSVALPTTVNPAGLTFFYAISNPTPTDGANVQFRTEGPATVSGHSVTFAPSTTPLTLLAGKNYTIALYAATASAKLEAAKIYVVNNLGSRSVTTYNANGSPTTPTITEGLSSPVSVAVDAAGKIYVTSCCLNNIPGSVTTYDANGIQTIPTITSALYYPGGLAVDGAGKIYVANRNAIVTTYNADGTEIGPSIDGVDGVDDVAVDAAGKIYVTNGFLNVVTTYDARGTRTTPTITDGLNAPRSIAVDAAGKIYVTNLGNNSVTTYDADGNRTTPTITAGLNRPCGVAVDAAGKIYVVNNVTSGTVTTYSANGTQTTPTITEGLTYPTGIAVH